MQAIAPEEFLDAVFLAVIEGVAPLEAVEECDDILPPAVQDEMYVVGHQDESQYDNFRVQGGLDGDIIHCDLEIFFVPEPQTVFKVSGREQINLFHSFQYVWFPKVSVIFV